MKRLLAVFVTILFVFIWSSLPLRTARAQDTVGGGADPIITKVDSGGVITVIRRFPDGSRVQLAQTDSLSDAQKAWLDGVNKLLQGK